MFGEGVAVLSDNYFIQLTWKADEVYKIDRETLELVDTYELFDGIREGWGVTSRPKEGALPGNYWELFISDGSSKIKVVDWEQQ